MKIKKIKGTEQNGFLDFRRVQPLRYDITVKEFEKQYNIHLPDMNELEKIGDPNDLWILLHNLHVTVIFKDSSWVQFNFKPGFITDLASVPKFFRSLIDNDDIHLMLPALCHDANFTTHSMTFTKTNALFRQMIVRAGGSKWKAFWAWVAVNSIAGRAFWGKAPKARGAWTAKTFEFDHSMKKETSWKALRKKWKTTDHRQG